MAQGMAMLVCQSIYIHHFVPDWNSSITIWWILIKFCADICDLSKDESWLQLVITWQWVTFFVCLFFREISQLLNRFPWNMGQTWMVPRLWILMIWGDFWNVHLVPTSKSMLLSEMSPTIGWTAMKSDTNIKVPLRWIGMTLMILRHCI